MATNKPPKTAKKSSPVICPSLLSGHRTTPPDRQPLFKTSDMGPCQGAMGSRVALLRRDSQGTEMRSLLPEEVDVSCEVGALKTL